MHAFKVYVRCRSTARSGASASNATWARYGFSGSIMLDRNDPAVKYVAITAPRYARRGVRDPVDEMPGTRTD